MAADPTEHGRKEVAAAWAVHAFTTSGIVLGFLALLAILEGDLLSVFLWLGLALFVDGIDGTLARKARVSELTPHFDGATLDNVIDFFNYVAVPAMMIYWFNFVPEGWATAAAAAVMAVSCYTFANLNMKTHDYWFSDTSSETIYRITVPLPGTLALLLPVLAGMVLLLGDRCPKRR